MSNPPSGDKALKRPALHWILFLTLTIFWGSSFALTKFAIESYPVLWMMAARLTLGVPILFAFLWWQGENLPPLSDIRRWGFLLSLAVIGMILPQIMVANALYSVPSGITSLYVAVTPLLTVIIAAFLFADEKLTTSKIIGFVIGFLGLLTLIGFDKVGLLLTAELLPQLLLLIAALMFAGYNILGKAIPPTPPITIATGYVLLSSFLAWPIAFIFSDPPQNPTMASHLAVIALALTGSSFGAIIAMTLIRIAGPSFMSLVGYANPVWALFLGWIIWREPITWQALLGFGLIVLGVWYASRTAQSPSVSPPRAR